jgi:hypothetical protein
MYRNVPSVLCSTKIQYSQTHDVWSKSVARTNGPVVGLDNLLDTSDLVQSIAVYRWDSCSIRIPSGLYRQHTVNSVRGPYSRSRNMSIKQESFRALYSLKQSCPILECDSLVDISLLGGAVLRHSLSLPSKHRRSWSYLSYQIDLFSKNSLHVPPIIEAITPL